MPTTTVRPAPLKSSPRFALDQLRQALPLRALGWLSVPFFPLFCLFIMDYMNYSASLSPLVAFWQKHPKSAAFEAVVVVLLFTVLLLVVRRVWITCLAFGGCSLICAYVNYMKAALNGDHFFPQDIAMVSQAGELTSFLSGNLPRWFWLGLFCVAAWVVYFCFVPIALPRPFLVRWSMAALLVLIAYTATSTPTKTEQLLNRFGMSTIDAALQSSNYAANGFVGAFTINALSMQVAPPLGYSRQTMEQLLVPYQQGDAMPAIISDAPRYDVVVVLSESFFDPRTLPGVTFTDNPLPNYDRLLSRRNCQSGMLYTTAVGGGTVRPEFGILTGLTTDYMPDVATPYWYVKQPLPTYVSGYKDAGYATLAVHPYDKKFYSRDVAYPHLGFDAFYGQEEVGQLVQPAYKRGYVTDETTFEVIQTLMDEQSQPTFLFAITMENHQPFLALTPEEIFIGVDAPALSQPSLTALTTYTQGLSDADAMLGQLAAWIDARERPTVLVFFGDHLPTLGANFLAYNETGFVDTSDGLSSSDRQRLYSTPFLIYSNRELGPGLLPQRQNNAISDYNLLNTVALSTGMAQSDYMRLLADFYRTTPFYNNRLELPLTPEIQAFTHAMELVTYDRVMGSGYTR